MAEQNFRSLTAELLSPQDLPLPTDGRYADLLRNDATQRANLVDNTNTLQQRPLSRWDYLVATGRLLHELVGSLSTKLNTDEFTQLQSVCLSQVALIATLNTEITTLKEEVKTLRDSITPLLA